MKEYWYPGSQAEKKKRKYLLTTQTRKVRYPRAGNEESDGASRMNHLVDNKSHQPGQSFIRAAPTFKKRSVGAD